jgi:hypothetical protein
MAARKVAVKTAVPTQVLEQARRQAGARSAPPPPAPPRLKKGATATLPREKVIAALKKLHPMD